MKEQDLLNEKLRQYKNKLTQYLDFCNSPIERIMSIQLAEVEMYYANMKNIEIIQIIPQNDIYLDNNHYIADFMIPIIFKYDNKIFECIDLIIECDGHNFHEKTKEQVIKNNKRDRDLLSNGYQVLHFSGSEIFNDFAKIKWSIINFIENIYIEKIKKYSGE